MTNTMMCIQGQVIWDVSTKLFSVGIPLLGVWTQGEDKGECLEMATDAIATMHEALKFSVKWSDESRSELLVSVFDKSVYGIVLKEARSSAGLSIEKAAKELGYKNHNSIYCYEVGKRQPTMAKFHEIMSAYGCDLYTAMVAKAG